MSTSASSDEEKQDSSLGLYCIVDFEEGPQCVPSNWLDGKGNYCMWPPWADTIDQTRFDKNVKKRVAPEGDWKKEGVVRVRAHGDDYSRIRAKLKEAEENSDSNLNTSCNESDKKSRKKRRIKRPLRLEDCESDDSTSKQAAPALTQVTLAKLPPPPAKPEAPPLISLTSPQKKRDVTKNKTPTTPTRTSPRKIHQENGPRQGPPSPPKQPQKKSSERAETPAVPTRSSPRKVHQDDLAQGSSQISLQSPRKKSNEKTPTKSLRPASLPTSPQSPPKKLSENSKSPTVPRKLDYRGGSAGGNQPGGFHSSGGDNLSDKEFKKLTLTNLKSIRLQVMNLPREVAKVVVAQLQGGNGPPLLATDTSDETYDDSLIGLPALTDDEFLEFNEKLGDKTFRDKVVNALGAIGGATLACVIRGILSRVLGNNVAQLYSFVGGKGKKRFDELRFKRILYRAVRVSDRFKTTKDKDIQEVVAKWLANSKARAAGKKNTGTVSAERKERSSNANDDDASDSDEGNRACASKKTTGASDAKKRRGSSDLESSTED